MKKSTMKKLGSMILACLMVVSTFATFSTVTYAENDSYKTKIHETYLELDPEELAALTADPTTYDISVFIEFVSSAEELAALYSDDPTERRENGKNYHSNKNKKLKEALELENAYVSNLAPFAEIQYDSLEEYEASWKQIRSIAKSKDVKDIDVSITNLRGEDLPIEEAAFIDPDVNPYDTRSESPSNLIYELSDVFSDVGIEDNLYTGEGIYIGVIEVELPDSTEHLSAENYYSYGAPPTEATISSIHAKQVTSLIGGTYGIAKEATILCAATSSLGFLGAVEILVDEQYVELANISMGRAYTGLYDNESAYLDYLSYQYNCLFIKSAGNEGEYNKRITSPGCSANALTVGAMNKDFLVSSFSSYEHVVDGIMKPDMVAPGEEIVFNSNVYPGTDSGTSFAAPIVTGIAARLLEEFPTLDSRSLKAILIQSCDKITNQTAEHDIYAGAGLVNYSNARAIAQAGNYKIFTKTSSMSNGAYVGMRTIVIPANSKMHLYYFAQNPGKIENLDMYRLTSLVYSTYEIGIGRNTTTTYYTSNYIVFENTSSTALEYAVMLFLVDNNWGSEYEWISIAYDFTPIT